MAFTFATDQDHTHFRQNRLLIVYAIIFGLFWTYTGFHTPDLKNWWLENTLTFTAIILLVVFYKYFRFSDFSYTCIFLFMMLHVYGSQYTYAENPFGFWVKEQLSLERNHYDRLVHFSFGFLLAYPMHEILWRKTKMRPLFTYLLPIDLTISLGAFYELIEWAVADVFFPAQGMAYLGTQGDIWDAQKDIAIAMVGAMITMGVVALAFHEKRK
jgi:putative membrane protein